MSYDPYNQGWYLLPINPPINVPSPIPGLTSAQIAELNAHTIQGLIETVYVRVGNDVLYQGLNGLDMAIYQTTQTLNSLSSLQTLKNALITSSRGNFSAYFNYNSSYGSPTNYQYAYQKAASAFFGIPIVPDFIFKKDSNGNILNATVAGRTITFTSYANNLAAVRSQLSMRAIALLSVDPTQANDPNSLYNTVKAVLNNLPPIVTGSTSARISWTNAKLWALDRYNVVGGQNLAQNYKRVTTVAIQTLVNGVRITTNVIFSGALAPIGSAWKYTAKGLGGTNITITYHYMVGLNPVSNGAVVNPLGDGYLSGSANNAALAGQFQQNITLAITAAQSLNNTQTEQVRAYMLNFEQFYKSASALLSAITQIIQNMAQNIRPA